jgi:hypothetical protein
MSENDRDLLEGLRALAAMEPREAPARVEQLLIAKFRARSQRRRLALWGSAAAGLAAMAAGIAVLVWMAPAGPKTASPTIHAAVSKAPDMQPAEPVLEETREARDAIVHTDDVAGSFYPLPEADALPPLETAMVVRVQMPMASLRLMGLPVNEDSSVDPVQADVLLGQDGLARGVRLIQ